MPIRTVLARSLRMFFPALVALAACREQTPSSIHFVEVTQEAGITFDHDQARSEELYQAESLCAGAIFFDADQDGDQDLYFLNGSPVGAEIDDSTPVNTFYLNDGHGAFSDGTADSGLGDPRYGLGVAGADYDNDGDVDLYVTNFEVPNALFQNDGSARFKDVALEAGVPGTHSNDASVAFADLDSDGWLDLYVCNYNDHSVDNHYRCSMPKRDGSGRARRYCTVERYPPVTDVVYRNLGDGTFEDVSESSGIGGHLARSFGISTGDYDLDGDTDIFVASDRSPNLFFENLGGFRFKEIGMQAGVAVNRDGEARAGMGVCARDLDLDGDLDIGVTYFEGEVNGFYENRGNNVFAAWEPRNGTGRSSFPYIGWGIEFFDADLDRDLDCMLANGHFIDNAHLFRETAKGYEQKNLFYLNTGEGDFELLDGRAGPGLELEQVTRGLQIADIDNDGDMDVLAVNLDHPPALLRNDSAREGRHWLMVQLVGTRSNRDGIGARISVQLPDATLVREVRTGQSFAGQSDLRQHFGLGLATEVPKLEVAWPSGAKNELENVAADQLLRIVEPE